MKKSLLFKYLATGIFALSASMSWAAQSAAVCTNTKDNAELMECLNEQINLRAAKLRKYLAAARKLEKMAGGTDKELVETQKIWTKYSDQHCEYVFRREPGTSRYRYSAECQIRMLDDRIYEIWVDYLAYYDERNPLLPNPKK
ncbi:lysozyme inhibitor LprI family protein [Undibacterium luofuense]|uniref:DUF1311 domain-containing protein n=1 Tax=Undibacterium luofuense TaxID=2828733 RepID=A0A941I4X7_9BURK|nr:lysozyme inhibitor LprI family protein [Undibacterium luofuense]MBR7780986.1 DUF1311 domain-containing protein [Undibacterium luofuense]